MPPRCNPLRPRPRRDRRCVTDERRPIVVRASAGLGGRDIKRCENYDAKRCCSQFPGPPAQSSAHPPSQPPWSRETMRAAGRTHGDARPTRRRTSSRNTTPARPVRGRPWKSRRCTPTVLMARTPVRYLSVDPATQRPTALRDDTPRDREETARIAENSQLAGRFRRWWQVLGSNQRRLSRRFYRPRAP